MTNCILNWYAFTLHVEFCEENNIDENAIRYGESFDTEAIDSETIVIDSIGQRLTLHLDNVIGGGGQRFISLFCPYWVSGLSLLLMLSEKPDVLMMKQLCSNLLIAFAS